MKKSLVVLNEVEWNIILTLLEDEIGKHKHDITQMREALMRRLDNDTLESLIDLVAVYKNTQRRLQLAVNTFDRITFETCSADGDEGDNGS